MANIGDIVGNVGSSLWDEITHPFPSSKAHDPVSALLLPNKRVRISALAHKWDDWDAGVATAIALAESGGRVGAQHRNSDGSIDRGLWQINSVHSQYDAHRLLTDPEYNAQAAHDIWKAAGGSFTPWTTYKTGAYKLFLRKDATVTVDPRSGTPYENSPAGTINSGLDEVGKVAGALTNPGTWLRIGKGSLGGVLVILGAAGVMFVIVAKTPTPVGKAIRTAKKVTQ